MNLLDRFRPYIELKTGIVNLQSGTSFRCVIWRRSGSFLVLRNVEMLQDRERSIHKAVDGEVIVKLADVDFVQVLG